jgi:hypothetical protein
MMWMEFELSVAKTPILVNLRRVNYVLKNEDSSASIAFAGEEMMTDVTASYSDVVKMLLGINGPNNPEVA